LKWFQIQSDYGLVGEIDQKLTGNGIIICKEGFKAGTFSESDFQQLTRKINKNARIFEVDNSSIFCEIFV